MEKGVVWPSAGGIGREGAGKPGPGYLRKKREGGRVGGGGLWLQV